MYKKEPSYKIPSRRKSKAPQNHENPCKPLYNAWNQNIFGFLNFELLAVSLVNDVLSLYRVEHAQTSRYNKAMVYPTNVLSTRLDRIYWLGF